MLYDYSCDMDFLIICLYIQLSPQATRVDSEICGEYATCIVDAIVKFNSIIY